MEDMKRFAEISEQAFRNRAVAAAQRAAEAIEHGEYFEAASAISEAIRYDGIAKEYGFIIEVVEEG